MIHPTTDGCAGLAMRNTTARLSISKEAKTYAVELLRLVQWHRLKEGLHLEHIGQDGDSSGITSPKSTRGAADSTSSDSPTLFPLETSERSTARLWPTPTGSDAMGTTEFHRRKESKPETNHATTLAQKVQWIGSLPAVSPARISPSPVRVPGSKGFARDCGLSTHGSLARYDRATRSWRTSERSLDGDLIEFSGALPRSGTMRSGVIYGLPTSERRTAGSASGLWPTPDASEGEKGGPNRDCLPNVVGGGLNPQFVAWLMGYPLAWTDTRAELLRVSLIE